MPYWTMKQYNNDKGTIAGWGYWAHNTIPNILGQNSGWNSKLKEVDTFLYSNEFCKEVMKKQTPDRDNAWHTITE